MSGKGDKRRKAQVPQSVVDANWDRIRRNNARKKKREAEKNEATNN